MKRVAFRRSGTANAHDRISCIRRCGPLDTCRLVNMCRWAHRATEGTCWALIPRHAIGRDRSLLKRETGQMPFRLTRRMALTLGVGGVAAAMWGGTTVPALAKNDSDDLIKKFTGGKAATEGRVRLDLPEIAENGNTVP